MPLVCRCGHQLERHRSPKLVPCTSTRLWEPLDEQLEKICTRSGDVLREKHVRKVARVPAVAHDKAILVGDSPVERYREEKEVVVVRGITGVDETHSASIDGRAADQRRSGHDETPDANQLDELIGLRIPLVLPGNRGSGLAVEGVELGMHEPDVGL